MTYQLYRLDEIDAPPNSAALGDYADFDTALIARDRDVIAQLSRSPMPPREIGHVIVGPGPLGEQTPHPVITFAGAEITDPDPAAEVVTTQEWLDELRGRR